MYYRFLTQLMGTLPPCRHHRRQPRFPVHAQCTPELLQALNIHVVGEVSEELRMRSSNGKTKAENHLPSSPPYLSCATATCTSVSGKEEWAGQDRIKEGLRRHYREIGKLVRKVQKQSVPFIATTTFMPPGPGGIRKQDNIYIGNKENIAARDFPEVFDYVPWAHPPPPGGGRDEPYPVIPVLLIPLSFSETKDEKGLPAGIEMANN